MKYRILSGGISDAVIWRIMTTTSSFHCPCLVSSSTFETIPCAFQLCFNSRAGGVWWVGFDVTLHSQISNAQVGASFLTKRLHSAVLLAICFHLASAKLLSDCTLWGWKTQSCVWQHGQCIFKIKLF